MISVRNTPNTWTLVFVRSGVTGKIELGYNVLNIGAINMHKKLHRSTAGPRDLK
jgi:hypothetical protein